MDGVQLQDLPPKSQKTTILDTDDSTHSKGDIDSGNQGTQVKADSNLGLQTTAPERLGRTSATSSLTACKEITSQSPEALPSQNTSSGSGRFSGESRSLQGLDQNIPTDSQKLTGLEAEGIGSDHSTGVVTRSESTLTSTGEKSLKGLPTEQSSKTLSSEGFNGTSSTLSEVVASIKPKPKNKGGRPRLEESERRLQKQAIDKESKRSVIEAQALHGKMLGLSNAQTARAIGVKEHQVRYALKRFEQFFPELEAVPAYLITKTQLFSNIEMRVLKSLSGKLDDGTLKDLTYAFKEIFHANRLENDKSTNNTKSQTVSFTKPPEPPKGSSDN